MKYSVEYHSYRYLTVTVEAEDELHAEEVADAVIAWGYEPMSTTHELQFQDSKAWEVNDVAEAEDR